MKKGVCARMPLSNFNDCDSGEINYACKLGKPPLIHREWDFFSGGLLLGTNARRIASHSKKISVIALKHAGKE